MAASDHLNKELFHGTTAGIPIGGVVKPADEEEGFAYATPDIELARKFAKWGSERGGTLFGTVYKVKPLSKYPQVEEYRPHFYADHFTEVMDPKGFEVLDIVEFPLNPQQANEEN